MSLKMKNPTCAAVNAKREEDWGRDPANLSLSEN
jgi:hypothetical protein